MTFIEKIWDDTISWRGLPKIKIEKLPHITKVQYSIDNIKKLASILEYIYENLFEKKFERIVHLIRIFVQISVVKALKHF